MVSQRERGRDGDIATGYTAATVRPDEENDG